MLRARVLGRMEVEIDGVPVRSRASLRPWALFGYLAITPGTVSRSELAERFWPEVFDTTARASLRSALWALRRQIGASLVVDEDRIGLLDAPDVWIDAREFDRAARAGAFRRALQLTRGDLLEGLDDDWAILAREHHRAAVVDVLEALAASAEACGDPRAAIVWSQRQVERDPLDEEVCRRLLVRLAAAGDRAAALRAYGAYRHRLQHQLGVPPSSATRELVDRLRAEA